jgi:hypothetical protein
MGVPWTMEIISWIVSTEKSPHPFFIFFDFINCMQGLWLFIALIFDRKVRKYILKKYGFLWLCLYYDLLDNQSNFRFRNEVPTVTTQVRFTAVTSLQSRDSKAVSATITQDNK